MIIDYKHPTWNYLVCKDKNGDNLYLSAFDLSSKLGYSSGMAVPVYDYWFRVDKSPEAKKIIEETIPTQFRVFF